MQLPWERASLQNARALTKLLDVDGKSERPATAGPLWTCKEHHNREETNVDIIRIYTKIVLCFSNLHSDNNCHFYLSFS